MTHRRTLATMSLGLTAALALAVAPGTVAVAPVAAGLSQTQALRAELEAAACDVPAKLLVRGWRGHRADRGGDIDIIPQEPDFVGTGGLPHSGPWDYVAQVPLWLYGPGHIQARGEVDRVVTLADIAPTQGALVSFPFDAPDGQPVSVMIFLLVPEQASQQHLDLLSELAQMLSDKTFRQSLLEAPNPEAVHAALTAWEPIRPAA